MTESFTIPTPTLSDISTEEGIYSFTLGNVNVSLANAIRRTILSDIPIVVFYTETHKTNQCNIEINTSRLHNEILKQRISCIPIHSKKLDTLPEKYIMELDVTNDTDNMIIVTTEDFKIKNKETGNYLTDSETRKIFPPNEYTNHYIDFTRLRSKISETVPGEQIKLSCEFSVHTPKENSSFNIVSKCTYYNKIDSIKNDEIWTKEEEKLVSEGLTKEDIEFQKKNYYLLDAQRHFIKDSFVFNIQTVGVYENKDIMKLACLALQKRLNEIIQLVDNGIISIIISETTMDNCYDIILENEDYTIGKIIEYILYERHYIREKIMTFCGFKIFHPHNSSGTIRVAFSKSTDKGMIGQYLRRACVDASEFFKIVNDMF